MKTWKRAAKIRKPLPFRATIPYYFKQISRTTFPKSLHGLLIATRSDLTVLHQNISGAIVKSKKIHNALSELLNNGTNVDVLCLTETYIERYDFRTLEIPGYKIASNYSRLGERRGGSCILLRNDLERNVIQLDDFACKYSFECTGIEIYDYVIICIYRRPQSDVQDFIKKLKQLLSMLTRIYNNNIILCGDWNINILKDNSNSKALNVILSKFNMRNHIVTPTRKESCLDLFVSNIKNAVGETQPLALSDHETAQILKIRIPDGNIN